MPLHSLPPTDENTPDYDPQLDAEDEQLSSGNTRLGLIVGGLFLAGLLTVALVPKSSDSVLASVTPSFMLDDAAVTGAKEVAVTAAPAPVATAEASAAPAKPAKTTATPAAPREAAPAPSAAPVAAAAAPEPVAAATPEPVAAEPARPSTVTLTGRILDEEGKPMAGATVLLKGSGKGTGTDANGNYTLEAPAGDNTLVFGYGGYRDEEIRTQNTQPVNVTLTPTPGAKRRRK